MLFDLKVEKLNDMVKDSKKIVFFGGAGVSTESGIPDFRSADGLYNQKYAYPPETILSHTFFTENTEEFYVFYKEKMLFLDAKPNMAHSVLTKLEQMGKLSCVITQNIDGLHQKAGSTKVLELHGSVLRNYCTRCKKFYSAEHILNSKGVPKCQCGGVIKPDVVLYEEALNMDTMKEALKDIENADMLIVAGTSLAVYPAASMIGYFSGNYLVLINKSETHADKNADLVIHRPVGEVLGELLLD